MGFVLTPLPQRLIVAVTGDSGLVTRASLAYQIGDNLRGEAFSVMATQAGGNKPTNLSETQQALLSTCMGQKKRLILLHEENLTSILLWYAFNAATMSKVEIALCSHLCKRFSWAVVQVVQGLLTFPHFQKLELTPLSPMWHYNNNKSR